MLLQNQDVSENLVMMQQGNGGLAKKGSMSVAGKKRAGQLPKSSGRAMRKLASNAAAVKASDSTWKNKTGTKGSTRTPKLTKKTAPAAAAAVRASDSMWG